MLTTSSATMIFNDDGKQSITSGDCRLVNALAKMLILRPRTNLSLVNRTTQRGGCREGGGKFERDFVDHSLQRIKVR